MWVKLFTCDHCKSSVTVPSTAGIGEKPPGWASCGTPFDFCAPCAKEFMALTMKFVSTPFVSTMPKGGPTE